MKKTIFLLIVIVLAVAYTSASPLFPVENASAVQEQVIDTQHYKVHLVRGYPSSGSLEALVTVDDKRTMVIDLNSQESPRQICQQLYQLSITRNPSPCGQLR